MRKKAKKRKIKGCAAAFTVLWGFVVVIREGLYPNSKTISANI